MTVFFSFSVFDTGTHSTVLWSSTTLRSNQIDVGREFVFKAATFKSIYSGDYRAFNADLLTFSPPFRALNSHFVRSSNRKKESPCNETLLCPTRSLDTNDDLGQKLHSFSRAHYDAPANATRATKEKCDCHCFGEYK